MEEWKFTLLACGKSLAQTYIHDQHLNIHVLYGGGYYKELYIIERNGFIDKNALYSLEWRLPDVIFIQLI